MEWLSRLRRPRLSGQTLRRNEDGPIIAIVGRTGSGMSQFIHDATRLYEHGIAPNNNLRPFTTKFESVTATIEEISPVQRVTLIDTPGFDYTSGNDEHTIFRRLSDWFREKYPGLQLDGVVYMYNIWNEDVYRRSPFSRCAHLERLCGPEWRRKVIFVNSHWNENVTGDGSQREDRLRTGYWESMLSQGSAMMRYESPGNRERAIEILRMIIRSDQSAA